MTRHGIALFSMSLIVVLSSIAGLTQMVSCSSQHSTYGSNGERIYFTAKSESGQTISRSGGGGFLFFRRNSCSSCHGHDGKGNSATGVSDISWKKLSTAGHTDHPLFPSTAYAHEGHSAYDEDSLRKAITEGFTPDGEKLKKGMPRWRMSPQDLDDLVAFIKTL